MKAVEREFLKRKQQKLNGMLLLRKRRKNTLFEEA